MSAIENEERIVKLVQNKRHRFDIFIIKFEQISFIVLWFTLLTMNK